VVTGEYSWVDPDGALHLVRYKADETGFHIVESLKQPGFVKIVPKLRTLEAASSRAPQADVETFRTSSAAAAAVGVPAKKLVKKVRVLRPSADPAGLPVIGLAARPTAAPPVRASPTAAAAQAAPLPITPQAVVPTAAALTPAVPFVSLTPFQSAAPLPPVPAAFVASPAAAFPVVAPAVRPQLLPQRFVPSSIVPAAPAVTPATFVPVAPAAAPLQLARDTKQLFGNSGETVVKFNAPSYNYEY
jgi:hypothetical protein